MTTYKIQINEDGSIWGRQKIEADDDAFWVDGIVVPEAFHDEVESDLLYAFYTWYFDFVTETFLPRPGITATANKTDGKMTANGSDLFILTGLPNPCTVTVSDLDIETDDIISEITDGEFGFPTAIAGEYKVKVESFPYITKEWTVVAT